MTSKLMKHVEPYLKSFKDLKKIFEGFDHENAKNIVIESIKSSFIVINIFSILLDQQNFFVKNY